MLTDLGVLNLVGMARQDSGKLSRFAAIYPDTKKMASEIETYSDVAEAMDLGYVACGAGGFFGEKRRTCKAEFSIAAKLVKALRSDKKGGIVAGYAGKLGDASTPSGSWVDYDVATAGMPAKFIVSAEAPREELWNKMLSYGRKGDALHDELQSGGSPKPLLRKADALALAAALRTIATSTCLAGAQFAQIVSRLRSFIEKVETSASLLDA